MKCYIVDVHQLRKDVRKKVLSHGTVIRAAGLAFVLLVGIPEISHASTGIDVGAEKVYRKLLNVGKWVIIIKGGIDTVKSIADGDLPAARKNFLGYILSYAILWALPWGMKEIDKMFEGMDDK